MSSLLEQIRAALSKMTPGEWRVETRFIKALKEKFIAELPVGGGYHGKVDMSNADAICTFHNLLPAFLAEVEAKDKKLVALEVFANEIRGWQKNTSYKELREIISDLDRDLAEIDKQN